MALLWMDGFETYGPADAYQQPAGIMWRRYVATVPIKTYIAPGRNGGCCARWQYNLNVYTPYLTTDPTLIAGVAFKCNRHDVGPPIVFRFTGASWGITLRAANSGRLQVYNNSTFLGQSDEIVRQNAWAYIEMKVITGASGYVEVRLNGRTVLTLSGVDTRPGSVEAYHSRLFWFFGSGNLNYFDDLYVLDGTPGLNDFLGPVKVVTAYPSADTEVHEYQRQPDETQQHHDYVNQPVCDDDTTYKQSTEIAQTDLYEADTLLTPTTIHGVQLVTDCRNSDGNPSDIYQVAKLNGTLSDGAKQTITTSNYTTVRRIMETDPEGNAWTLNNFNNTQFGFRSG